MVFLRRWVLFFSWITVGVCPLAYGQVHVAVASNFLAPLRALADDCQAATGHQIVVSAGSTGKLYAQIVNGAPYDLFFAASEREPSLLERDGWAVAGSRYTYAVGILALWAPYVVIDDQGPERALAAASGRVALANPKVAPYGAAAKAVLESWGLWNVLKNQVIRGENVAQAYQFAATGNVQFAFVALVQLVSSPEPPHGRYWPIAQQHHAPIRQQAVILKRASENADARAIWDCLKSDRARERIAQFGYRME